MSAALPWLYLKGISTGDMGEALSVLLGEEAKGLSANVVSRLNAHWSEEWQQWDRRDLRTARYVYWWADGIHTGVRSDGANGQCILVIVGVPPAGRMERVAIADGFRELTASWREVLLDWCWPSAMAPWASGQSGKRCVLLRVPSAAGSIS